VFASAIAKKPDGIITVALPATQVADKLAQARKTGIKTIGVAAIPQGTRDEYDVYVQLLEAFTSQLEAWYAIADSNGTAKVVYLWDYGYPHLVQGAEESLAVMKKCRTCKVLEVYKRELATAADPVAMQKITTSLIQKYGKDLQYILTPYGFGVTPVIEATRAAGRSDIKVLSKNAEVLNLGQVAQGKQRADFGTAVDWAGYAAIDQIIRLFAGQKPLKPWQEGLSVRVFTKANAPKNGVVDWTKLVDFKTEYKRLWGVR
jgi:ribose transport system substrate-binding protein